MGMLRIETGGSFGTQSHEVSAMKHGHAQAADAITWLSSVVLPAAIERDHALQKDGDYPEDGRFGPGPLAR